MITLRPYQQEAVAAVLEALQVGKHPVCSLPTGSGKSIVIADLCHRLEGRVLVVTHRKELISQNERTASLINSDGIGAYSAGLGRRDTDARIIFGGIQSIYNRMDELQAQGDFRYIIWDEAHHAVGRPSESCMATTLFNACPTAQRIGLSATPYRLKDGPVWADTDAWFDTLAIHKTIYELTNAGYLCRLVGVQTAARPDLSHVRTRGGDFALGDLSQASSEESVVNAACDEILHLAQDRKHIMLFCVDRAHAGIVGEALTERGCKPEIVLGNTPSDERDFIFNRFKQGLVRYLINVNVATTGFDAPSIDAIAILRATQSKSLLVQMMGRGCRLSPEKTNCIAQGQLVLTDQGLIPIERVPLNCKVWDGVEWVSHDGPVYKGTREVITYAKLTATEDHRVYTEGGWKTFGECASRHVPILQTGYDRFPIRQDDCSFTRGQVGGGYSEEEKVPVLSMSGLWCQRISMLEFGSARADVVSNLCITEGCAGVAYAQDDECEEKVQQPQASTLSGLRWEGDSIQFSVSSRCLCLGKDASRARERQTDRQDRQRWTLRVGESQVVYPVLQPLSHENSSVECSIPCFPGRVSSYQIRRSYPSSFHFQRDDVRTDRTEMAYPIVQAKREVWDLLNCGPRNRFTVSGLLVHNCIILDAGGNLRRHMPIDGLPNILRSPRLAEEQRLEAEQGYKRKEREREARHDALVARGIGPLDADNPDLDYTLLYVKDCSYLLRTAKKYPSRKNLIVSYKCLTPEGSKRTVTQFVLLDYPGRPGVEATAWFARRGLMKPQDSRRALAMAWEAPRPSELVVGKNGQWDHILMEYFEEEEDGC